MSTENEEIQKITPYQKLQNIFSEGEEPTLTDKGNDNLNRILGLEDKPSFWDKIKKLFSKIDGLIFAKNGKVTNRFQRRK